MSTDLRKTTIVSLGAALLLYRHCQRDGANVFCQVPIPMTRASLGGSIEVPAVDGTRVRLTLPAGTQTGQQFRIKGKGLIDMRTNLRGDMYVQVAVETPVNLTRFQQELLREFEEEGEKTETSPGSADFLARMREFWEDLAA